MRVFNDIVIQLVIAMKAVYLDNNITSLSILITPFEAITLEAAIKEDTPSWKRAIYKELSSLLKI